MDNETFKKWLEALGKAWINRDPVAASKLCSEDVLYFEDPFLPPSKGREAVKKIWLEVPTSQTDVKFNYEILVVNSDAGVAKWSASFTRIPANTKAELEGVYLVKLDDTGLCKEFHQWWNSKNITL